MKTASSWYRLIVEAASRSLQILGGLFLKITRENANKNSLGSYVYDLTS